MLVAGALVACAACSGGPTPQQRIARLIDQAERQAEQRDLDALLEHVSSSYQDRRGRNKAALRRILAFELSQNRSLYLFKVVDSIEVTESGAQAVVFVAMAGQPVEHGRDLERVRAEVARVQVSLREEDGVFKVSAAEWDRAALSEMLTALAPGGPS